MNRYCGCHRCKLNGEVNPHELFEQYYANRTKGFDDIFLNSYNVGEMEDIYDELEEKFEQIEANESQPAFDAYKYWNDNWRQGPGLLGG